MSEMEMRVFAAAAAEVRPEIQVKSLTVLKVSCRDTRKPASLKKQMYLIFLSSCKLPANVFCVKIWGL